MDVKVGDEVRVFSINGSRMGQPKGGWPGTVIKVGRKLFYVEYSDGHFFDWEKKTRYDIFRLETGQKNDKDFGYQTYVKTEAQVALDLRRKEAIDALRAHGIQVERTELSLVQLEELACMLPVIEE